MHHTIKALIHIIRPRAGRGPLFGWRRDLITKIRLPVCLQYGSQSGTITHQRGATLTH